MNNWQASPSKGNQSECYWLAGPSLPVMQNSVLHSRRQSFLHQGCNCLQSSAALQWSLDNESQSMWAFDSEVQQSHSKYGLCIWCHLFLVQKSNPCWRISCLGLLTLALSESCLPALLSCCLGVLFSNTLRVLSLLRQEALMQVDLGPSFWDNLPKNSIITLYIIRRAFRFFWACEVNHYSRRNCTIREVNIINFHNPYIIYRLPCLCLKWCKMELSWYCSWFMAAPRPSRYATMKHHVVGN